MVMRVLLLTLFLSLSLSVVSATNVTSSKVETIKKIKGKYQYYYDEKSSCESIIMLNVGTSMSVQDYSEIATDIVAASDDSKSMVVIIIDNNPRVINKTSPEKFAGIANAIVSDISNNLPLVCQTVPEIIMTGGHSAGGQATIQAIQEKLLTFPVAGYIGLAPFEVNVKKKAIDVPSINWGFSRTSCGVTRTKAAMAAYQISNPKKGRVFYEVQTHNKNTLTGGPHCSFTNSGCAGLCSGGKEFSWIHDKVADSVGLFVKAVAASHQITKEYFEIDQPDVTLFVNEDHVTLSSQSSDVSERAVPATVSA